MKRQPWLQSDSTVHIRGVFPDATWFRGLEVWMVGALHNIIIGYCENLRGERATWSRNSLVGKNLRLMSGQWAISSQYFTGWEFVTCIFSFRKVFDIPPPKNLLTRTCNAEECLFLRNGRSPFRFGLAEGRNHRSSPPREGWRLLPLERRRCYSSWIQKIAGEVGNQYRVTPT